MNKKSFLISTLIFSGVLALGSVSNALALFMQPAANASFNISQEIEYYLKGTFNEWGQSNTYKFVNNTAGMSEEDHKVREYKLENIPLAKAAELKIWANNDAWFKDGENNCSYEHRWSNVIDYSLDDEHNYIVPMTSNTYSFYLKFYDDGSSKVYITANKDTLYFIPSNNWKKDDAYFVIEQYEGDTKQNTITDSVEDPTGTFKFVLGTTYSRYKFVRMNPSDDSVWNYSNIQDISNSDTNNCFALWDAFYGGGDVWSGWDAASGTTPGYSCGVWSAK